MAGLRTLTAILIVLVVTRALAQGPDELLRRSDVGGFSPRSFRARLVLTSMPQGARHEIEVWRSGDTRTLIRFMDPKERGKFLLRLDSDVWLITPGAKKPVHLSPSYRLYGGATLDEILGIRLASAYQVESVSTGTDAGGALVVLELRAKAEGSLFPRVRYVVRETTERPVVATYRLRSGRDATAVEFLQWNERGLVYAKRLIVSDLLRKGAQTEVAILEVEARAIPDGLFSLTDPTARQALP
ncbi:MAG: outer membrane lipoprotein-sorting protein [Vicinamibacterales bacterium]